MCGLEGSLPLGSILQEALAAAQNIQDSVFRARSTAQVNAMMRRWWPMPDLPDLKDVVAKFSLHPGAVEFTALHIVGEKFPLREKGPDKLPLDGALLEGKTLSYFAEAFRLPLADFVAANAGKGWDADTLLMDGTEINVPDPEFAPLVAARLAAEVVAADWLFPNEKRAMIQSLVIMAIHDRTAMDAVLARLLLAAASGDLALLERLLPLARQVYAQFPDSLSAIDRLDSKEVENGGKVIGVNVGALGS